MGHSQLSGRESRRLGERAAAASGAAAALGLAGLAAGAWLSLRGEGGAQRFFFSYLVNFLFFLSLSLGALFFVVLQHLTRAGWSVVVRRLAEAVAANVGLMAALLAPILAMGMQCLYPWARAEALAAKRPYLTVWFFAARCAAYFAVWIWLARQYFKRSVEQDASGDVELTRRMERSSPVAMILFALTTTFASFDFLMSLDPHWFSAIFGVYFFSGCALGFLALLALMAALLQAGGRLQESITPEHYHDIGKLIFAFVGFWAYIAFSQYLLIWYADLPEETAWIERRQTGQWAWASWALLFGHFFIPFLVLLSRFAKRRKGLLACVAVWVLIFHWIDLAWLAMPELSPQRAVPDPVDAALFVGVGGLFVAAGAWRLRHCSLIPERDPRLAESLAFENI